MNMSTLQEAKNLRLSDNTQYSSDVIENNIPKISSFLTDRTLKELQDDNVFIFPPSIRQCEDLSDEQVILRRERDNYLTSNILGFIGFDEENLTISSRFAEQKDDFFVMYMISKVLDIPNISSLLVGSSYKEKLLSILPFVFPSYLKMAARKGLFKCYVTKKYNEHNFKGRLDLPRHIKRNTPFMGKVAFNNREFSFDNHLTQLVRHTIEFIKAKNYGRQLLDSCSEQIKQIADCTPSFKSGNLLKVIAANEDNILRHDFFFEYRSLQKLCMMILRQIGQDFTSLDNKINGIIFDGAWLWEEYLALLLADYLHHPKNKSGTDAQQLFSTECKIYPDFIGKNNQERLVADAKYKPESNITRLDYYQILSYMFRFDCKSGIFFYPGSQDKNTVLYLNKGNTFDNDVLPRKDVFVSKLQFNVPSSSNYQEFVAAIQSSEQRFIAAFKDMALKV